MLLANIYYLILISDHLCNVDLKISLSNFMEMSFERCYLKVTFSRCIKAVKVIELPTGLWNFWNCAPRKLPENFEWLESISESWGSKRLQIHQEFNNFLKKALGRNSASLKFFQTHLLLAVLSNFIYDRPFLKNLGNGTMPPLVWGLNVIKDGRDLQEKVGCFLVYFV